MRIIGNTHILLRSLIICIVLAGFSFVIKAQPKTNFADHWEFAGTAVEEYARFERPQLLLKDGKPGYLYLPSGVNIYGGACTISYVLKFKGDE